MTYEKDKDSLDTFARTTAPDLGIPAETCLVEDAPDPCTIVIMGASGDLTERKIIPALFRLYVNGATPDPFTIVGCARTDMDDQSFRVKMKKALGEAEEIDSSRLDDFAAFLHYRRIDYGDHVSFESLAAFLHELENRYSTKGNRIFYLAIPPTIYKSTARALGEVGLSSGGQDRSPWSR